MMTATEIQQSVKRALQSCCQQLRTHLAKRNALKDAKNRKSRLARYVPDISRSLYGLLDGMRQRRALEGNGVDAALTPTKRLRLNPTAADQMIERLNSKEITEGSIRDALTETIDIEHPELLDPSDAALAAKAESAIPLFIVPLYNFDDPAHDIFDPLFTFRPIFPVPLVE